MTCPIFCRQPLVADAKAMLHVNRLLKSAIHACGANSGAKPWAICDGECFLGFHISSPNQMLKLQKNPWEPDETWKRSGNTSSKHHPGDVLETARVFYGMV